MGRNKNTLGKECVHCQVQKGAGRLLLGGGASSESRRVVRVGPGWLGSVRVIRVGLNCRIWFGFVQVGPCRQLVSVIRISLSEIIRINPDCSIRSVWPTESPFTRLGHGFEHRRRARHATRGRRRRWRRRRARACLRPRNAPPKAREKCSRTGHFEVSLRLMCLPDGAEGIYGRCVY